ncbi:MAG: monovalent cation/hydrogen antiporter [Streptosporangiaceae bacterium]|nr:monovalent cation/hydrogen antiporter [Streptosporangiaceae bacterium]
MTATQALALLLLIVGSCAIAALARRRGVAAPILLVLTGLGASYIPGVPEFRLSPNLVLFAVLPPLVYATALESSYLNLRDHVRTLALLSVGLVLFTALVVGGAARLDVPGLPLAAAITLGAILAPTDAVTTASIGRRLHLPRRLLTVITGESMLNDGTALTLSAVAVSAAATTVATPSPLSAVGSLVIISAGGIAAGLVLGVLIHRLRMRIRDPLVESALSLLTPFAAYLAADSLHVSGVLAVVVTGLYLGHHGGQAHFATRLQDMAVWRVTTFVLESVAFALIGLQLRPVLQGLGTRNPARLATEAAVVLGAVVLARIVWVFPSIYLPRWLVPRIRAQDPAPSWRATLVLSWAGLRGVISLAAAAALPTDVPQRNLLVFLTFTTVLGTLLVQGLTLPWLIHWLGVRAGPGEEQADAVAQARAQEAASEAGLRRLDELAAQDPAGAPAEVVDRLRRLAEYRQAGAWERLPDSQPGEEGGPTPSAAFRRLRREMTTAERAAFIRLRDERQIDDEVLDEVLHHLDLEEAMLSRDEWDAAGGDPGPGTPVSG